MKKVCSFLLILVLLLGLLPLSVMATEAEETGKKLYSSNTLDAV